ncbi:hypothetical protein [Sulfurimonas sp. HSL3-7]|uniref:hypothetical protein n=1 Tax=Sulfonitrofixus jiaomeiensis TaxID=3131938 RepID=UPI0031F7D923
MKKAALSTLAAMTLSMTAYAEGIELYTDPATGQIFTQSGEGREAMGRFVSADAPTKEVPWYSHADKLKFGGLTYLGFTHTDFKDDAISDTDKFEMRRAYVQIKAYLLEDPKSYFRVTLDMEHVTSDATAGDYNVRFKYAYLYLNEILPYTGVELGMAHRPWIDYEEHNSWFYRDTHWTFTEADNSAKLSNSADLGVNFKTETKYFGSEVGLFTGEGYHNVEDGAGISFEWRATAHLLGENGKDKQTTTTYWDASFFGQYNMDNHKYTQAGENQDLIWGGLHTVFNMPSFMVAAQYIKSEDTIDGPTVYSKAGEGYNAHAVYRFGSEKQFRVVGRYDAWTPEEKYGVDNETLTKHTYYGGFVWEQNKNIEWVANVLTYDNDVAADSTKASGAKDNSTNYMLTAQVSF